MTSTNQDRISDEDDMYANAQQCLQSTTTAQTTCMPDIPFDSHYSTLHKLEVNSSATKVMNGGNSFDSWSKGDLLELLAKAYPDIFPISILWNKEEVLIKEFAQQHLMSVEAVAELRLNTI